MSGSSTRVTRRVVLLAAVGAGLSCGDLPRTNPVDPSAVVGVSIVGPDSTASMLDTVRFAIVTDPQYAHGTVKWSATGGLFPLAEPGAFRFETFDRGTVSTVTATVDGHGGEKTVVLRQRPSRLKIAYTPNVAAGALLFTAPRESPRVLRAELFDRHGYPVQDTFAAPTLRSHDPAVATGGPSVYGAPTFQVQPHAAGRTWIVATRIGLVDSIPVDVRQLVTSIRVTPGECRGYYPGVVVRPGQSFQIVPTLEAYDAAGDPIADTALVRSVASGLVWSGDGTVARVTATGLVTAVSPGWPQFTATSTAQLFGVPAGAACSVYVSTTLAPTIP